MGIEEREGNRRSGVGDGKRVGWERRGWGWGDVEIELMKHFLTLPLPR